MFDGNDGAAARHFRAHEFRRDEQRHRSAEALAVIVGGLRAVEHLLAAEIFALGDVDHLLGDDALARPFELRHRRAVERAHRPRRAGKVAGEVLAGDVAVVDRLDRTAVIFLDAAALLYPRDAGALQTLLDVDRDIVVGVDAGRIVDPHRLFARALRQRNFAKRHAQVGRRLRHRIDLARSGNRAGRHRRRGEIGFGEWLVHGGSLLFWLFGAYAA